MVVHNEGVPEDHTQQVRRLAMELRLVFLEQHIGQKEAENDRAERIRQVIRSQDGAQDAVLLQQVDPLGRVARFSLTWVANRGRMIGKAALPPETISSRYSR